MVGLLGFIQRDLRQSGFQPVAFELRIDDRPDADDPDAPRVDPVELDDGAGHIVRIVGTVTASMPCRWKSWAAPI